MATRYVFAVTDSVPYFTEHKVEFDWTPGTSTAQMRKNIEAMHSAYAEAAPSKKVLEISTKSVDELGREASAFNLQISVPSVGAVKLECAYQASKVFENGGPFTDLLTVSPQKAKADPRLKKNSSGNLLNFSFDGQDYILTDTIGFYDYLYITALMQNPSIADSLMAYDAFTDVAFTPDKSRNCQARSAAVYVSLRKHGLLDEITDFESFLRLTGVDSSVPLTIETGDMLRHKAFGEGTIIKKDESNPDDVFLVVKFPKVGQKKIQEEWAALHCEVIKKK